MGLEEPMDITAEQRKTVLTLLNRHLPNTTAWVYGSRTKWTASPQSDLDIVVFATPKQSARVSDLKEAFEESNLPFRVDLFAWDTVPEDFRKQIEADHAVLVESAAQQRVDGWMECRLAEACSSINYGLTAPASSGKAGPHFLRITDIVSGHIDWKCVPHVVVDEYIELKYRLYDGDIVMARTGASTGMSTYVKNPPRAVFASYLVRLQAKPDFDARFLSYYLKSMEFWDFIRGVLGDKSAQPNASASTMTTAPLRVPKSKAEQRTIAHILGTLDDKIELNRRTNETLEAMAQALFKSWFVHFDPVRAKMEGRHTGLGDAMRQHRPHRAVVVRQIVQTVEIAAQTLLQHAQHQNPPQVHARTTHLAVGPRPDVPLQQRKQLLAPLLVQVLKPLQHRRYVVAGLRVQPDGLDRNLTELKLPLLHFTHASFLEDRPQSGQTSPIFPDYRSRRYIFATENDSFTLSFR